MKPLHHHIAHHIKTQHNWFKKQLLDMAKNRPTPHDVALGFAVGVFVGLAVPGFDLLVGLFVMYVFKLHKLATIVGLALINPLTNAIIYPISYKIGTIILGTDPIETGNLLSLKNLVNVTEPLLLGNLVLAIALGILSYALVYYFYNVTHYSKKE